MALCRQLINRSRAAVTRTTWAPCTMSAASLLSAAKPIEARFMATDAKAKALEAALAHIEKSIGKGSVMKLGQQAHADGVDVISTGSLTLDVALGIGGLPRGRVVEVYGPEASGKTTIALLTVAEAQKKGLACMFIDVEHAIDPVYCRALGVDVDSLLLSQPDSAEQALEIADTLIRSGGIDVIVVDSVAALVPRAELQGEMGDHHMALQARLMSQALRKMTGFLGKSNTLLMFINQIRSKVGVMFGSPEVTAGGAALKYYSSVRLDIRRTGQIKEGDNIVGNSTRVKVVKNKVAPPFKQAEFDMTYGFGISRTGELVDLGLRCGLVIKAGAWFSLDVDECKKLAGEAGIARAVEAAEQAAAELAEHGATDSAAAAASGDDVEEEAGTVGNLKTGKTKKKVVKKVVKKRTKKLSPEAQAQADAEAVAEAEAEAAMAASAEAAATAAADEDDDGVARDLEGVISVGQGREKVKTWLSSRENTFATILLEEAIRAAGREGKLNAALEKGRN